MKVLVLGDNKLLGLYTVGQRLLRKLEVCIFEVGAEQSQANKKAII